MIGLGAVGLECPPVTLGGSDQRVIGILVGFANGKLQGRGHFGQGVGAPERVRLPFIGLDRLHLRYPSVQHLQAEHVHGLAAVGIQNHRFGAGIPQPLIDDVPAIDRAFGTVPERLVELHTRPLIVILALAASGTALGLLATSALK